MSLASRLVTIAVAATLTGCTASGAGEPPAPAPAPTFSSYVALGDSFTAGPFVPTTDVADGCFRSDGNYPSLLAERLEIDDFTDVSCSGVRTRELNKPYEPVPNANVPPQLAAVDRDTELVTIGIGGNDFGLFSTLVQTCTFLRAVDPEGSPCADSLESQGVDLEAQTERIGDRVARAVRQVQRRAPDAEIVVVGYLRLAPDDDRCPRDLPFADGDYELAGDVTEALNAALETAAADTGARFVDMYAASENHDVCAEEPWVNGRRTDRSAALAYHPFAAGMVAVADEIEAVLG